MPTGYTHSLEQDNKSTGDWFAENLCRAFGMCIMLREESSGLSRDQIRNKLVKESSDSYHKDRLEEAKKELDELSALSHFEWEKKFKLRVEEIEKDNAEAIAECDRKRMIHEKARDELMRVRNETEIDTVQNICKFGIDQLDMCRNEVEDPHTNNIPQSARAYRSEVLCDTIRDIKYHEERMPEHQEREDDRLDAYNEAVAEVDRILGTGNALS